MVAGAPNPTVFKHDAGQAIAEVEQPLYGAADQLEPAIAHVFNWRLCKKLANAQQDGNDLPSFDGGFTWPRRH
jgi:hypothetical protein